MSEALNPMTEWFSSLTPSDWRTTRQRNSNCKRSHLRRLDPASVVPDVEVFHDLLPGTFESWAGTAVAFWDEKSTWIRKTALSVHVVDVDGNKLGSASTEALVAVNHIDNIPGADQ